MIGKTALILFAKTLAVNSFWPNTTAAPAWANTRALSSWCDSGIGTKDRGFFQIRQFVSTPRPQRDTDQVGGREGFDHILDMQEFKRVISFYVRVFQNQAFALAGNMDHLAEPLELRLGGQNNRVQSRRTGAAAENEHRRQICFQVHLSYGISAGNCIIDQFMPDKIADPFRFRPVITHGSLKSRRYLGGQRRHQMIGQPGPDIQLVDQDSYF